MDKNEVTGSIKEVKGATRGAIGQAVRDAKLQGRQQAGRQEFGIIQAA